jgi:hypothetical protein
VIKCGSDVVGILPHNAAVIRRGGAILLDMHDEWTADDRRSLAEGLWPSSTNSAIRIPSAANKNGE